MRTFILPAVLIAALALAPSAARAAGYYPAYGNASVYFGNTQGYYPQTAYGYTPYYSAPVYNYPAPRYPYEYSGYAPYGYDQGFHYQWHDHAWNTYLGGY